MMGHKNVECYKNWQYVLAAYGIVSILPFSFYMMFAPNLLKNWQVSLTEFFIGCFCPLLMAMYWLICKTCPTVKPKTLTKQASNVVYDTLQGPYKEMSIRVFNRTVTCCWAGVLLQRRLVLILIYTYIHNISYRLTLMTSLCLIYLFLQMYVRPCKENSANLAGSLSSLALVIICCINLVRAMFEVTETTPTNANATLIHVLDGLEDLLLIWLPLVGIILIFIVLLFELFFKICPKTKMFKSK